MCFIVVSRISFNTYYCRLMCFCSAWLIRTFFCIWYIDCCVLLFFCDVSNWDPDYKVRDNSLDSCYSLPHMGHTERFSSEVFLKDAPVSVGKSTSSFCGSENETSCGRFFFNCRPTMMSKSTILYIIYWYPLYLLASYM